MCTKIFQFVRQLRFASLVLPVLLLRMSVTIEPSDQNFWQQTNGPYGGYIGALAIAPNGNILAAAYGHGVFRSSNSGASWEPVNAGLTNSSVQTLVSNAAGDFFAWAGGVFRLKDNSNIWTGINNGLQNNNVTALAINAAGHLFAGTTAANRIKAFRSTDNGDNWTEFVSCLPDSFSVTAIAFTPNGEVLLGVSSRGVFRVTSDGSTCTAVNTGLTNKNVQAFVINASGQIFAGTKGGIFRSTDNAGTWTKVNSNQAINFAINSGGQIFASTGAGVLRSVDSGNTWTAANNGLTNRDTYALAINANGEILVGTRCGVFRSSDNGDNWVDINTGLLGFNVTALVPDANGRVFAGIGRSPSGCSGVIGGFIFRSDNDGNTWEKSSTGLPAQDVQALVKNSKGEIYAGTTGGLYRSSDNGGNWTPDQTGMGTRNVRALAVKPAGEIFAGTADGVFRSNGSGSTWTSVLSNKNILALTSNAAGDIFAGADSSRVFRSTDNGNTWLTTFVIPNRAGLSTFAVDLHGHIFAGISGNGIFRSTDNGDTWTAVNTGLANKNIFALAGKAAGFIFAGTTGGVFYSGNDGDLWTAISSGLTHQTVYALAVDSLDILYAGTHGGGVFRQVQSISGIVVWPGDTNNDKLVNQNDVLPLGLHWNKIGPAREKRSTSWVGQPTTPWSPEAATYADANGDGVVNQSDVLPIGLNWGKTHSTTALAVGKTNSARMLSNANDGGLCYTFTGSPNPGQEFWVEVQATNVTKLFGLSFEMLYSPSTYVDPQTTEAGSFMNNDVLFFPNIDKNLGKISIGISQKVPQTGVNGSGVVARVKMRMAANAPTGQPVTIHLQNALANDPTGAALLITPSGQCTTTGVEEFTQSESTPTAFALHANSPNPFNPSTTIKYDVMKPDEVKLIIYDLLGRPVRTLVNQNQQAGRYAITWDGRNEQGQSVASGTFIYQIRAGTFVQTRRMALVR